jgi:hypothetical protein
MSIILPTDRDSADFDATLSLIVEPSVVPQPGGARTPSDARRAPSSGTGSGSNAAVRLRGAIEPPPYVDDRLVEPETREELVRGRPRSPGQARARGPSQPLRRVIGSHATKGFIASADLLTHAGPSSDFATDVCVRRDGTDPRTGDCYLEELAFEVVHTQSRRSMTARAKDLTKCGVRRVFAFFVKTGEVCEWSPRKRRWLPLDLDGTISDPVLVRPIPVRALLDAAVADDAVVDPLDAKGNPRLVEIREASYTEGRAKGRLEAIETARELLDIPLGPVERTQLAAFDDAGLATLLAHIKAERCWR